MDQFNCFFFNQFFSGRASSQLIIDFTMLSLSLNLLFARKSNAKNISVLSQNVPPFLSLTVILISVAIIEVDALFQPSFLSFSEF